jgi:hypothetical protein
MVTEITCTLRARWIGFPLPRTGDYLMSPTRPRFAYHVRDVSRADSRVRWDPERKAEYRYLTIVVERVPPASVPTSARVLPWHWDKRGGGA